MTEGSEKLEDVEREHILRVLAAESDNGGDYYRRQPSRSAPHHAQFHDAETRHLAPRSLDTRERTVTARRCCGKRRSMSQ